MKNRLRLLLAALALVLLGAVAGLVVAKSASTEYQATNTTYVGVSHIANVTDLSTGQAYVLDQMPSFAEVAVSPVVLDPVAKQLGLSTTGTELAKQISTTTSTDSTVLSLHVTDKDPLLAAKIANAAAKQMDTALQQLTGHQTGNKVIVEARVITPAAAPELPNSTPLWQVVLLGALAGAALAAILWVLYNRLEIARAEAAGNRPARGTDLE